ncbi:MAG TPA: hypothetical protein ENN38_05520 [Actinobacteria bacterium]|nr:hypothetical protein [Actinomycetota bacterium]
MLTPLEKIADGIRKKFDVKEEAREKALSSSRQALKSSTSAVRALHREEYNLADDLLSQAKIYLEECKMTLKDHPDIFYAGFVHDAQKEYAEAIITQALILDKELPSPEELGVEYNAFLNGLGEAIGELRRRSLDLLRVGKIKKAEEFLKTMDDMFYILASFGYPEAITRGLRRTTDVARSIMEKTRGDLTTALCQNELQQAIKGLDEKMG